VIRAILYIVLGLALGEAWRYFAHENAKRDEERRRKGKPEG
jgi:hypothetical protein